MGSTQEAEKQHVFLFRMLWGVTNCLEAGKFGVRARQCQPKAGTRKRLPSASDLWLCQRGQDRRYQRVATTTGGSQGSTTAQTPSDCIFL